MKRPKLILVFPLCSNYFLLPFLESLLCITVMYYNIKTVITISILYVKYKYMYQDLCIYISIGWIATTDSYITYIYIIPTINEVTQSQIKFYQLINIFPQLTSPMFNYRRLVIFSFTECIQIKPTFSDEFLQEKIAFSTEADSNCFMEGF